MRVFGYCDNGAVGYYRMRLPFAAMAANGIPATWTTVTAGAPVGAVVVAQQLGFPGFELPWLKMWRKHPLVWETDDDLWTIDPHNRRADRQLSAARLEAIGFCVRTATMVTVSTEPLAEVIRERFGHPHVVVLPNHIDAAMLNLERPRRDRVTIGWAGGDSHFTDMQWFAPILKRFLERTPQADLHTIGWGSPKPLAQYAPHQRPFVNFNPLHEMGVPFRHTGWVNVSKDDGLFGYYRNIDFDIGLAPLAPLTFNRSKSAIKALEYAALGIPVLASDCEAYRPMVLDGVTGFLVKRDHEWGARLRDLVNDEAMRSEMGARARENARRWVIQDGWRLWAAAYQEVAEMSEQTIDATESEPWPPPAQTRPARHDREERR